MAVLSLEDVFITRGGESLLVSVDLSVDAGQSVALMGASGTGKTTLLHTVCGLRTPSAGAVRVGGGVISALSDARRAAIRLRRFGLVFQSDELLPELTVGENVGLPLRLIGQRRDGAVGEVRRVLEALGIADLENRRPHEVSGGQAQRAAIARAVVHRPDVVLADEPTASLDEDAARTAMALLIDTARLTGAATLVVTHDPDVADRCDAVVHLDRHRPVVGTTP